MTKRTSNFSSVKRVASRTPVVIALCAASLLSACGNGSPTTPTQAIDDAHITVTDLLLDHCSDFDTFLAVRGTIQNTGSETMDDFLDLRAIFYNEAGRLDSSLDTLDSPFAPGEQRRFTIIQNSRPIRGWTYFRLELDVALIGDKVVECTGCDSRNWPNARCL